MTNKEIFQKFKDEIEKVKESPCDKPYDLSGYDEKTRIILSEIDKNRNHSWIKEIWLRNKDRLNTTAMVYRGKKFTYEDFFVESYRYAMALKTAGLKKGQTFVAALENSPEFPFLMGATSMIGARINIVSAEMDPDYLVDMMNKAKCKYVFASDMSFSKFATAFKMANLNNDKYIVSLPLNYTLSEDNPYLPLTEKFYKLDEAEYNKAVNEINNFVSLDNFLKNGENYHETIIEDTGLNDELTITYTSGSTGWGKPKALIHKNRSYITMGRYHDSEVSGIPTMENRTTLALIKPMSDTDFMANISDTFMQGGIVALEPINSVEYFLTSMLINKPTLALASRSFWLYAMKQQKLNPEFKNIKMPYLLVPTSVGEPLAANEEKALNKWLKEIKSGTEVTKTPFSVVSMSVAGGDSEHGGIFLVLFRALQSKRPSHIGIKEPIGMGVYDMVQIKALREDGTYCGPMEPGNLVANSPCNMLGYYDNEEANKRFFIKSAYGKTWGNLGTYGYIDKKGNVYVKGRISNTDTMIPNYRIADVILKDTKKIMSCEVVNVKKDDQISYVAHLEPQMDVTFNEEKVLKSAASRCSIEFGEDLLEKLYFRIRTNNESFKLLHTGKRNNIALVDEGISEKCVNAKSLFAEEKSIKPMKR